MKRFLLFALAVAVIVPSGIVGTIIIRAASKPHSVLLKWNPPPAQAGVTVASYEVYRTQADGTFARVASGITTPNYLDRDVGIGQTYKYFVRAVDTRGNPGPFSNTVSAPVPSLFAKQVSASIP